MNTHLNLSDTFIWTLSKFPETYRKISVSKVLHTSLYWTCSNFFNFSLIVPIYCEYFISLAPNLVARCIKRQGIKLKRFVCLWIIVYWQYCIKAKGIYFYWKADHGVANFRAANLQFDTYHIKPILFYENVFFSVTMFSHMGTFAAGRKQQNFGLGKNNFIVY